jgi:ATP-dependent helicase/nuclease subunit B
VGGGAILQPVLYALAAEKLLNQQVAAGRLYYCTAAGGYEERVVELNGQVENGAWAGNRTPRDIAREVAAVIAGALTDNFLPAAPAKDECKWCDYRMVCGPHEELRLKRKPTARLLNLSRLRELP